MIIQKGKNWRALYDLDRPLQTHVGPSYAGRSGVSVRHESRLTNKKARGSERARGRVKPRVRARWS